MSHLRALTGESAVEPGPIRGVEPPTTTEGPEWAEGRAECCESPQDLRLLRAIRAAATLPEPTILTDESFRLRGPEPSIILRAGSTKNRRPAEQPIPGSLARDLALWLRERPEGAAPFPLHPTRR